MSEAAAPGFSRLLSDTRLTRRAVGGDERAFAAIFRRYHQSLYRFCLAIVGNPEDAQDALQNTMVKVLRALPGEEREIDLKPWLYRIAHNESIDLLRRRRETRELDVEQIAPGYGLAEDAATRERLRRLLADLKELPARQREVLVMRELAGLGFEEIGSALETSGAVARQTLYEARQNLRQMEAGREMKCAEVTRALSDGDGRVTRRRDVRAHLRTCAACRAFREEIESRQRDLAALAPLPAVAAAAMLQGFLGGSQGAAGGGLAATLGGGAAKTIGASAAAKGVATAAVVAAIGITAADQTGAIHLGLPGEQKAKPAHSARESGEAPAATTPARPVLQPDAGHAPVRSRGVSGGGGGPMASPKGAAKQAPAKVTAGVAATAGEAATDHPYIPTPRGHAYGQAQHAKEGEAGAKAQGPPAEKHHGHGQEKQLPDAASGGKENGESHKPAGEAGTRGNSAKAHAEKPSKPSHPASQPSHPTPSSGASPPQGPEGAPANPPDPAPEPQAPAQLENPGKGPSTTPPGWSKAGEKGPERD
jgi:RNA polymerase sigma factor (sigma-70 family)